MADAKTLAEATPQEIQLELIRRRRFNQFDGPAVAASLNRHNALWRAVCMSMPQTIVGDAEMPYLCLRPLLSLTENRWQMDTLYVLCETSADAERLREIAREEDWQFDADEIISGDTLRCAVGVSSFDWFVLSLWWD